MIETIVKDPETLSPFEYTKTDFESVNDPAIQDMSADFTTNALKPSPTWRKATAAESINYPGRVHGKIVCQWMTDTGHLAYIEGSGTLIGPNHVITAAHNIFRYAKGTDGKWTHTGWPKSCAFYPVCSESNDPNNPNKPYKFFAKNYGVSKKFYDAMLPANGMKINYEEDWGIIFLSTSAEKLGRIDLEPVSDADLFSDPQSIYGYPYDNGDANTPAAIKGNKRYDLWVDRGRAVNSSNPFDHDRLYAHNLDLWYGMSGAGLFVTKNDGRHYIRGIQSNHAFYHQNNPNGWAGENRAVKITKGIYDVYQEWLKVR